jgi:signal transduction histidine kinase/HAMP domain-containing protein
VITLRTRLVLAQAPLALTLVGIGLAALLTVSELGRAGNEVLANNYRSVLAVERMKESLERLDSAALFIVAGEAERGQQQIAAFRPRFEEELVVQERNITEAGEAEATAKLRERWTAYLAALSAFEPPAGDLKTRYLRELEPRFLEIKQAAGTLLALNQGAMERKAQLLQQRSDQLDTWMLVGVAGALLFALWAAMNLTNRALQPVRVLSQAVHRLGEGDLSTRAVVDGPAELEQLSHDFNTMAEGLQAYRASSLGELLQAQQTAQAAIDSLPDPVLVFARDGTLLNMNDAGQALLAFSIDAAKDPLAKAAPAVREVLERVRAHVLAGKGAYIPRGYEEAVRVDGAGGPAFFLPRGSPVHAQSQGVIGATVVLQDVTRLRRFDELKNDLVATVAHEFRTPLTSLRMAIHLSIDEAVGPLTPRQRELLTAAREDCARMQAIVDDLLDLSRIQSGAFELELREVTAQSVLDAVTAAHQAAAAQQGLKLTATAAPELKLRADPQRLGLVLANLVSNALRYTPSPGEVSVTASAVPSGARFEVADTGAGIPAEHQKRIFEKFYRVPGTGPEGAGLGLAIAKEIIGAHGGEIGVDSAPGKGSRFWFTLPGSTTDS